MSHLDHHKPDQKRPSSSTVLCCKETPARMLACTQIHNPTETHTLTHTHPVHPNRVKRSVLSCDKQTHQGTRRKAFNFGQVVYHSSHPSAPLWVWDTDPGSAYCSQKLIVGYIHNANPSCFPSSVLGFQGFSSFLMFYVWTSWFGLDAFEFPSCAEWFTFNKANKLCGCK